MKVNKLTVQILENMAQSVTNMNNLGVFEEPEEASKALLILETIQDLINTFENKIK